MCIALHLLSTELRQVLDTLDSFSPAHQKCLRELQEICGARRKLPRSYTPHCLHRLNGTPGHDHCEPGGIFRWSNDFPGGTLFERMFPLDKVFSPEGTEVVYFSGVASFPCAIDQSNSSFAVLLGGNICNIQTFFPPSATISYAPNRQSFLSTGRPGYPAGYYGNISSITKA